MTHPPTPTDASGASTGKLPDRLTTYPDDDGTTAIYGDTGTIDRYDPVIGLNRVAVLDCKQRRELASELVRRWNAEPRLREACEAAIRYDAAIQKRAVDGRVEIIATGGGVAMGDDLDELYDDWISKARTALSPATATKETTDAA